MRIAWLTVAACAAFQFSAAAPGQVADLTEAQVSDLESLQAEAAAPTRTDETLVDAACTVAVQKIMLPNPATGADLKIAARQEALARLHEGLGASKGRVQAVFRDLAAEKLTAVLLSPDGWAKLSKADWLGRMHVMMLAADMQNGLLMTALQLGMADPNPAVRYHAVRGLIRIDGEIAGSAVRAIAQNRQAFLAALKKQALAESNGVVRRMLYRLLILQKDPPNPQNNIAVALLLDVATKRLDLVAGAKQLPGLRDDKDLFFERADVELAKVLGLSLDNEADVATQTKLATALARLIAYVAADYKRAQQPNAPAPGWVELPKDYQSLLTEILLMADGVLVACVKDSVPLLRNALRQPGRKVQASIAASLWVLNVLGPTFNVQLVIVPNLPPYKQGAGPIGPPVLPDDDDDGPLTVPKLPEGGGLPD